MFNLRLSESEIQNWSEQYSYDRDDSILRSRAKEAVSRGYLTKDDLIAVGEWKSPRSAGHLRANSDQFVRDVTALALTSSDEMARILPMTSLHGVGWPTASVLLHFFHPDRYPILDIRALWSLRAAERYSYNFDFWIAYVDYTRDLADRSGMSMRELDRALWEYSKQRQSEKSA